MKLPKVKKWNTGFLAGFDVIDLAFVTYFFLAMIIQLIAGMYVMAGLCGTALAFILLLIQSRKVIDGLEIMLKEMLEIVILQDEIIAKSKIATPTKKPRTKTKS